MINNKVLQQIQITIPFPRPTSHLNQGFFLAESEKQSQTPASIKFRTTDRARITAIARELDMSFSEFVRWSAAYAAIACEEILTKSTFDEPTNTGPDLSGYE